MTIEVLGTGCAKCNQLEATVKAVADKLGVSCEISHEHDLTVILQRGISATPALAIDGRVVVSGRIPSEAEIVSWLQSS